MAINTFGQMASTLNNYDAKGWSKSIEFGKKIDFKEEFPELNTNEVNETKSFGDFLADSVSKVNSLQTDANTAMQRLASGDSKNLHETLLAVERADIAFKQMNQVRMKVIDAYKEIMKMQI